jgi:hypothetical protein
MATALLTSVRLLVLLLAASGQVRIAPASDRHPTDVPKKHVQEINSGKTEYLVVQGGTMDGQNCRSPQGVWQPFQQTWESNRSVLMENVGQTDVINPWLSRGGDDFRTLDAIVATAVVPGMTDAEKSRALWWQQIQYRYHFEGDNDELLDPVKVFNIYGHNTCGNDSICLAGLWHKAGLPVAPARLVGHCVSQVRYDGSWHLMDGDMHSIYLLRDNETVAGEQDLVRDHDLIRRTHTQGILQPDGRAGDEWESSIYVFEGTVTGDRDTRGGTGMNMTLRPGESLMWRWGHLAPVRYHGERPPRFPETICNGRWVYHPDFTTPIWRSGAKLVEAASADGDALVAQKGKTGVVVWTMRSPYVFVGGHLDFEGAGAKFAISWDGRSWEDVGSDFDRFFGPRGKARYLYHLKCRLSGQARIHNLQITNDLQMAPLTLPGMTIGENRFRYMDESPGNRRVRLTHEWVERSESRAPLAPSEPIFPPRGGQTGGTDFAFRWKPATDPDGDRIADYHFELSSRPDMKWPLSMSFAKLISKTADAGQARYTLPGPGLLNPDQTYFWHVRAQDDKGVWGPWSATWSFIPRGPAPPREVTLEFDRSTNRGVLRWSPGPKGTRPVAYRVYASDEKGFSASDTPYSVTVGVSKTLPSRFPANFVAETRATGLEVIGTHATLCGANRAFYRVVAVDSAGKRSGSSDYAASPRPVISSAPLTRARKGRDYRYPLAVIRSLGDLRTRVINGKETMSFWELERPRFRIQHAPEWLSIDPVSGLLAGIPDRVGKAEVSVAVTLESDQQRLDESALKWGIEKVVASGVTQLASATQTFVIDVLP